MTPVERDRTLRNLLGAYLVKPDAAAWLIAADVYAETCDGGLTCCCRREGLPTRRERWRGGDDCKKLSVLWRARGTYFDAVMAAFNGCRDLPPMDERPTRVGGAVLWWKSRDHVFSELGVDVHVQVRSLANSRYVWKLRSAQGDQYWVRKTLQLIDENRELLSAEGVPPQ
jgi:hypothetical protein